MSFDAPARLGQGLLTWPPAEREIGRFGTVSLRRPQTHTFHHFELDLIGQIVRLAFTVTEVRVAALPPDSRLGAVPEPARAGEQIDLGIGVMFVLDLPGLGPAAVGVLPTEQRLRPVDWLDPAALYKAHNQYGQLTAHPYGGQRFPIPHQTSPAAA